MLKKIFIIISFFLTTFQPVNAKEYDLESILKLAVENNKQIKLAHSDLDFASAQMKEAISTALPKINLDFGYNRNFLENLFFFTIQDEETGETKTQSFKASFSNEYQFNAVLNQTIFSFGKVGNAIQAAKYFKEYTGFQFNNRWQIVITQVKKAFYQALLLQKVWEVAKQSEKSAKDNFNNLKTKFEAGVLSEFDLLQAEVRWMNSIPQTMQAGKDYEIAVNRLKNLVDIPLRAEITLIGGLSSYPAIPDTMDLQQIFAQRPDYKALLWEKKLQKKRIAIESSNHYPSLDGSLIYTYGARSDLFKLENDNDNIILGISLRVPVFSGGYTGAQVQKARVDAARVKTRISIANDDIRIELQNIMLRMREARERILAAQKSVAVARKAYEIAESRVEHGLSTQLELKDSRVFLDQAQLNFYKAIYDFLDAYFDWEKSTGKVSTANL